MAEKDGKWVTINGRHVFIPKGKKLEDVWDYQNNGPKEDNYEEDLSDYENENYEEDIDELSMSGMTKEEKEIYKAHKDEIEGEKYENDVADEKFDEINEALADNERFITDKTTIADYVNEVSKKTGHSKEDVLSVLKKSSGKEFKETDKASEVVGLENESKDKSSKKYSIGSDKKLTGQDRQKMEDLVERMKQEGLNVSLQDGWEDEGAAMEWTAPVVKSKLGNDVWALNPRLWIDYMNGDMSADEVIESMKKDRFTKEWFSDSDIQKEADKIISSGENHTYMMLDRMRSDLEYALGTVAETRKNHPEWFSADSDKMSDFHSIWWSEEPYKQIALMKKLHNSLKEKPEWLTMEQINDYERRIKEHLGK